MKLYVVVNILSSKLTGPLLRIRNAVFRTLYPERMQCPINQHIKHIKKSLFVMINCDLN